MQFQLYSHLPSIALCTAYKPIYIAKLSLPYRHYLNIFPVQLILFANEKNGLISMMRVRFTDTFALLFFLFFLQKFCKHSYQHDNR